MRHNRRRRNWLLALAIALSISPLDGFLHPQVARAVVRADDDSQSAIDLQAVLDKARLDFNLIGVCAAVIQPGQSPWTGVSGKSELTSSSPVRADMIFSVGSISKSFIAALIMQLKEEGKLKLDDNLLKWLPEVLAANPRLNPAVTIRQLLNHTSGVYNFTQVPEWFDTVLSDPTRLFTPPQTMALINGIPPYSSPGLRWNYSNTNYILAGLIVEKITGSTVEKELRRRIFTPLGMHNTFLDIREPVPGEMPHAYIDFEDDGIFTDFSPVPRTAQYSSFWTCGAIVSTAEDTAKWADALFSGKVVTNASVQEMINGVRTGPGSQYGLGVARFEHPLFGQIWYHDGATLGYISIMVYLPKDRLTVVVLTNGYPANIGGPLDELIAAALNRASVSTRFTGKLPAGAKLPVLDTALYDQLKRYRQQRPVEPDQK